MVESRKIHTIYRIPETFIFIFHPAMLRVTFDDSNILRNRNITMALSTLRFHSEHGAVGTNQGPKSYSGGVRRRNIFIPTTHVQQKTSQFVILLCPELQVESYAVIVQERPTNKKKETPSFSCTYLDLPTPASLPPSPPPPRHHHPTTHPT